MTLIPKYGTLLSYSNSTHTRPSLSPGSRAGTLITCWVIPYHALISPVVKEMAGRKVILDADQPNSKFRLFWAIADNLPPAPLEEEPCLQ